MANPSIDPTSNKDTSELTDADKKVSQIAAEYVAKYSGHEKCMRCSMFRTGLQNGRGTCTKVTGAISAGGHCKYWAAKAHG